MVVELNETQSLKRFLSQKKTKAGLPVIKMLGFGNKINN